MTREEAIDIIQSILNKYEEDECLVTEITIGDEDIKAFKMAIKALEQQELILDKIRAEIEQSYCEVNNDYDHGRNYGLYMATQIIDKYKGESNEPMQVDLEGDGYADGELVYDYGKCPKCGWEFEEGDKDWEQPYCCHCGQKLKWFDNDTESEEE